MLGSSARPILMFSSLPPPSLGIYLCGPTQGCLDSFVYGATATCGVLIVEGCVLEATKGWHELGSDDRQLLTLLAKVCSNMG